MMHVGTRLKATFLRELALNLDLDLLEKACWRGLEAARQQADWPPSITFASSELAANATECTHTRPC
jgi:hypothetical protein